MSTMTEVRKFLRLPSVIEIVGIQRTAIYDRIKKGTFPAPISLGPRAVDGLTGSSRSPRHLSLVIHFVMACSGHMRCSGRTGAAGARC